jgi:hypothetical protein
MVLRFGYCVNDENRNTAPNEGRCDRELKFELDLCDRVSRFGECRFQHSYRKVEVKRGERKIFVVYLGNIPESGRKRHHKFYEVV